VIGLIAQIDSDGFISDLQEVQGRIGNKSRLRREQRINGTFCRHFDSLLAVHGKMHLHLSVYLNRPAIPETDRLLVVKHMRKYEKGRKVPPGTIPGYRMIFNTPTTTATPTARTITLYGLIWTARLSSLS
jgi:hypothetical protein